MDRRMIEIQSVRQAAENRIFLTLRHPIDELDLLFYAAMTDTAEKFPKNLSATFTIYNKDGNPLMETVQNLSIDTEGLYIFLNQACRKPDFYFISLSFGSADTLYVSRRLRYKLPAKPFHPEKSPSPSIVDFSIPLYRYEHMQRDLKILSRQFPSCLTLEKPGASPDGRNIYIAALGNPAAPHKICIQASMHAREWKNTHLLMALLEYYCRGWQDDRMYKGISFKHLLNQSCFYFIPMANPDGVALAQRGLNAIRNNCLKTIIRHAGGNKNFAFWKANARGVNLNNNFPAGWENRTDTGAADSEHCKGPHPFSEPEAVFLKNFVETKNPDLVISYHQVGSVIYWMYGQQGKLLEKCIVLADTIARTTGYRKLSSDACSGGLSDWCVCEKGIPACTVETGFLSAPVSHAQFQKIYEENKNVPAELGLLYGNR